MDENEHEIKSPIKRLGSTRKLLVFNNIRLQLNEQLRCLDLRMEAQVALVTELQDFFRRRGELELDYSKNLDKLAKSLQLRHKEQKQKREQWPLFSSYACWQQLVTQTRNLSREHVALSEVYSTHLVSRLGQVMEDVQRIYKRCREIGYEIHEEILRVLHELHTTMKTYHSYQGELRQAEAKLRTAELQRTKCEQSLTQDKLERSKKYKLMEKEVMKRKKKYTDAKLKALKSRNEYILCLEASNTTIHKYFVDDLSDLIDCMDFGFHNCISRALLMHVSAEEGRQRSVQNGMDTLSSCINSLDSRLDKQKFLEFNHQAFMIPKKLEFHGQKPDDSLEPEIQKVLHQEMESRLAQLQQRVTNLRAESEEVWKTLETAESTLLEMLSAKDYDCTGFFGDGTGSNNGPAVGLNNAPISITSTLSATSQVTPYLAVKQPETVSIKLRADRQETEEFYLAKFREYLIGSTRIARLDAKHEYIRQALTTDESTNEATLGTLGTPGANNGVLTLKALGANAKTPRRKRIGRLQMSGQPKLFAGSLEEYLEATNQEMPLIVKSCIRVINLFGLHHQGIFRVSGSQVEINNFREWFERGEDPLADMTDASDINSVAGVLKLYLRELREPLFPIIYFEQFMEISQLDSKREFKSRMRELVKSLPRAVMIVLRYIFAFLNHLAEYSDENMMDPYNLAICFGPTLVPVPDDKDQVQYQNQVNELIKNVIMFNDEIFPNDGGCVYEKYISLEPDDHDVGDSPCEQIPCDVDSEVCPSEDDSECMEATAQFDFIARSDRELSLKKGDMVTLYSQVSNDWWRGAINGSEGLIPDKYISLKMKDDDRDKTLLITGSTDHVNHTTTTNNHLHQHHLHHLQHHHSIPPAHHLHHTHPPPSAHGSIAHMHAHAHSKLQQQQQQQGDGSGASASSESSAESMRRASSSNDSSVLSEGGVSTVGGSPTMVAAGCAAPVQWQQVLGAGPPPPAPITTTTDVPNIAELHSTADAHTSSSSSLSSSAAPATAATATVMTTSPLFQTQNAAPATTTAITAAATASNAVCVQPAHPREGLTAGEWRHRWPLAGTMIGLSSEVTAACLVRCIGIGQVCRCTSSKTFRCSGSVSVSTTKIVNGHKKTKSMHCIDTQEISHRTTINVNHSSASAIDSSSGDESAGPMTIELRTKIADGGANVNFSRNREQWQRRANSQSHIRVTGMSDPSQLPAVNVKPQRHSEINWMQLQPRQNHHTPDLVMDLPLSAVVNSTAKKLLDYDDSGSDKSSVESPTSVGPDSPDMQTTAERFAKQNQCTLKKNTKVSAEVTSGECDGDVDAQGAAAVITSKPQIKAKPAVLKKPSFSGGSAQAQQQLVVTSATSADATVEASNVP